MLIASRFAVFAIASLCATICGAFTIWQSDGSQTLALTSTIGWVIGLVAAIAICLAPKIPRAGEAVIAVTLIALAATFLDPGLSGVHRWITLGPLRANSAALLLPAFVAVLATGKLHQGLAAFAWLATMSLLTIQPDASQTTALAIASLFLFASWPGKWRWPLLAATVGLTVLSWLRPDPLQPVAEVEGIFALAFQISPLLAAAGLAALVAAIFALRQTNTLANFCAIVALMPLLGHFPVPLVGAGISFPLGWWLGFAVSLRGRRQ